MHRDLFSILPLELLEQILRQLDLKSLFVICQMNHLLYHISIPFVYRKPKFSTCKQFKRFVSCIKDNHHNLFVLFNKQEVYYISDQYHSSRLQSFATLVKEIDLSTVPNRWSEINNNDICNLGLLCHNITLLDLSLCKIEDEALNLLTKHFGSKLTHLSLYKCKKLEDFKGLAKYCTKLTFLDLSYTNVYDDCILQIIVNCRESLNYLSLEGCDMITDISIEQLVTCPNLDYVTIEGCYGVLNSFNIDD